MRSWACTLVPIAFTGVFATSRYISSLDPSWDASPQLTRRRSKGQSMFYVRSLVRSSSAGFGSVALPSHFIHSVAGAQRQPSAEVRRRLTLTARKLRDNRHTRNCYSSSRDLSKWRPTGQRRASSSTSSSSSSSSSNSSSRRRSCGTGTGTSTIRYSSSSNSSNNGENAAGTRGSHASADNQRAAQDDATTAVTPRLENSASDKNAVLASWPASLTPSTTGKIYISEIVKEAAQWLELHGVIDPEPSAAELLAKAAGYRSPQDMSSRLRVASLCDSTSRNVPPSLEMTSAEWDEMRRLCELRAAQHVPVQYLVGEWDFYGLSLEMQPPTLIPRPETEELVDRVLQWVRQEGVETGNNNGFVVCHGDGGDGVGVSVSGGGNDGDAAGGLHFLDVGSGTGVIGLTLLKELPGARCVAIDAQPAAVRLSRRNAERTGLQPRYSCFHKKIAEFGSGFRAGAGDGFGERTGFGAEFGTGAGNEKPVSAETGDKAGIKSAEGGVAEHEGGGGEGTFDGSFDFIVSNPPYIPKRDMKALPPDVADHEDSVALDGGEDGLDVVRDIVRRCPSLLRRGGPRELWMEVDTSHPEVMQRWLGLAVGGGAVQECAAHGVTKFEWMTDMSQRPRFVRLTFAEDGDPDREEER